MVKNNKTESKAELEKKIADLEYKLKSSDKQMSKGSAFVTAILVFLTALIFCLSIISFWIRQTIFDTNTWVNKTSAIVANNAVQQDISTASTQAIFKAVNVDQYVSDLLPDKAKPLASPISSSIKSFTVDQVTKLLGSSKFLGFWKDANKQAHSALIKTIKTANSKSQESATGEVVYIQKDKVMLNIAPVLDNIKGSLASSGLGFVNNINVSSLNIRIEIAAVNNLPLILFIANTINSLSIWLPFIALALVLITLWQSRNRRKPILKIAYVSSSLLLMLIIVISVGDYLFVSNVTHQISAISSASAQVMYSTITNDLMSYLQTALTVMIIVAIFAYLTGESVPALRVKNEISSLTKGLAKTPVYRWLSGHGDVIITASILISAFFIFVAPIKNTAFIITLAVLAGLICLLLIAIKNKK